MDEKYNSENYIIIIIIIIIIFRPDTENGATGNIHKIKPNQGNVKHINSAKV